MVIIVFICVVNLKFKLNNFAKLSFEIKLKITFCSDARSFYLILPFRKVPEETIGVIVKQWVDEEATVELKYIL